jgi:uncharacterized tellurite resistance protein B-like protein
MSPPTHFAHADQSAYRAVGRNRFIAPPSAIHALLAAAVKKDVDARDLSAFTRVHSPLKTGVNAL